MRIGFIGAGKVGVTFGKYITTKMAVSKAEKSQLEVITVLTVRVPRTQQNLPRPLCTIAWKNFAVKVKLSSLLFQMDR